MVEISLKREKHCLMPSEDSYCACYISGVSVSQYQNQVHQVSHIPEQKYPTLHYKVADISNSTFLHCDHVMVCIHNGFPH